MGVVLELHRKAQDSDALKVLTPHKLPKPDTYTYPVLKVPLSSGRVVEYEKSYYSGPFNQSGVYFWKPKEPVE